MEATTPNVLVWDPRGSHHRVLDRIIVQCGATAQWLPEFSEAVTPLTSQMLVVVLEDEPTPQGAVLGVIRDCRQAGAIVLAIGHGVEAWPFRVRCLPLLAGASQVFDCYSADFPQDFAKVFVQLVRARTERENDIRTLRTRMAQLGVVGESRSMLVVFRNISKISVLSDLPTLITGETGTGKELLAHAIHALDPKRSKGPFIALNCAALTPTLAEAELFGHRRGAFTGAERDRRGLIRAAHGGVLFLDEIGELDLALQAKLLRVLQENRVLSVGEEQEVAVSVRVVTATNRDLHSLVQSRQFRADLYHRLSVLSVHIPPLRERKADIPPLVRFFVQKNRLLRPEWQITAGGDFVEALCDVNLPGNVRQLESLVCQALLNKESDSPLSLSDLPTEVWEELCSTAPAAMPHLVESRIPALSSQATSQDKPTGHWEELLHVHGNNLAHCLEWCERALVAAALERSHGNQSQTARLLGITPRSVYNKIRRHHLLRHNVR